MAGSDNRMLQAAARAKKDEFYTQLCDIENELQHYREHFRGKTVLCNCDDPRISNFFHYFSHNFEALGLKRLITTCYKNQDRDFFSHNDSEQAIMLVYEGDKNGNRTPDPEEIGIVPLKGDGDFRSVECIALLREADIVVTNPPFSLFREYVAQLMAYNKKFIIMGNQNAITYKEIFPLIKEDRMWLGVSMDGRNHYFGVPDDYPLTEKTGIIVDGQKFAFVKSVVWFTNLENNKRQTPLILHRKFDLVAFPKYDNYDAINVDKVADIPVDYEGVMGVPITFLHKYCPEQFEIVKFRKGDDDKDLSINGKCPYFRILIRHRNPR